MRFERAKAGGVAATADRLSHLQSQGWVGSKSIHPHPKSRERRRIQNARTINARVAKAAARSAKDQAFRLGKTKKA